MLGRTHNMIAFAALLTAVVYYPPVELSTATVVVALIANTAGSMLPDLDQATNRLWDMLPFGDAVGKLLSKAFLSHRSLSHSFLGVIMFDQLSYWIFPRILNGSYINPWIVSLSLMIGYLSHLLADGVTEEGLPLLFPLKYKFGFPPIKSWRIKTGKWFENFVVTPLVIVYVTWRIVSSWSSISKYF